ncbi:acyl-CoA thioesterase domain-containing protein [Gordonia jacobaea]|uniref:acyl-CoA thioesterase domain-containing protein n=1 Tax=Gordonia jacobaea TaxID=122202 RepID=UPI003D73E095
MAKTRAFFTPYSSAASSDHDVVTPTSYALSLWAPGTLNGPAVCALAAHRVEQQFGEDGFRPARFTIDMFKVAREVPTFTRGRIVRAGRRIRVAELDVVQFGVASTGDSDAGDSSAEEVVVARATTVFLRTSANPPGTRWRRPDEAVTFRPPTEPIGDSDVMSRFSSDTPEAGVPEADAPDAAGASNGAWNTDMGAHQNGGRKRLWSHPLPAIDGEQVTAFVKAVTAAESTSLVTNWGSSGIGFINCDLTVELARLPQGDWVGVEADSHIESDGISIGTAGLFDSHGMFGIGTVTAVNNAAAEIDFTSVDLTDRYREA